MGLDSIRIGGDCFSNHCSAPNESCFITAPISTATPLFKIGTRRGIRVKNRRRFVLRRLRGNL